jgi:hypothetical protein
MWLCTNNLLDDVESYALAQYKQAGKKQDPWTPEIIPTEDRKEAFTAQAQHVDAALGHNPKTARL